MRSLQIPLLLSPVYSDAIWGGTRIAARFGRTDAPRVCAESWEVSGHPSGESVVVGGPYAGRTLGDLVTRFGSGLVGTRAPDFTRFPLLMKLIDADRALSIQVHPNERTSSLTGGEPKTEAWLVLGAEPGAALYAGVRPGVTREAFDAAARAGRPVVELMSRHDVAPGDVVFIPGGVPHAIGAGCLIFEVQQSSNTTYRMYDWDRVDAQGRPRALHLDAALKSVDLTLPETRAVRATDDSPIGGNAACTYLVNDFFALRGLDLRRACDIPVDHASFQAFFALEGAFDCAVGETAVHVPAGRSVLVPADAESVRLTPCGAAQLLVTSLV